MTTPDRNEAAYYRDCLGWFSGRTGANKPEPLGALRGLDHAEADKIAQEVYDAIKRAGGTPRPRFAPANAYQERRVAAAYVERGLNPAPLVP
jgi:hypothetical protein